MTEEDMPKIEGGSPTEAAMEMVDDCAIPLTAMRNRLLADGFSPQAAETGALQHQALVNGLVLEHHKADLRPRGLFG